MKKLLIVIAVIAVLGLAWYLISPAFISVERDDVSPLDGVTQVIELNTSLETSVQVVSPEEAAKKKEGETMIMKEGEAKKKEGETMIMKEGEAMMKEGEAMMKKGEEMMKEPAMEEDGKAMMKEGEAMMMKSEAMMETRPVEDDLATMSIEKIVEFMDAVEVAKGEVMEKAEAMPEEPLIHSQGDFQPRAHGVKGKAILITSDDGNILRFEDFETINGPNLHIYLSTSLGTSDIIDLGEIKATKGSINYALDPSIDLNKYNKVLVWCVPFRVLFSYAALL